MPPLYRASLISATQRSESAILCIYPFFFGFPSHSVTTEHWVEFPVLYSTFSLVIYFTHRISGVHASIPITQFFPPPPPWFFMKLYLRTPAGVSMGGDFCPRLPLTEGLPSPPWSAHPPHSTHTAWNRPPALGFDKYIFLIGEAQLFLSFSAKSPWVGTFHADWVETPEKMRHSQQQAVRG